MQRLARELAAQLGTECAAEPLEQVAGSRAHRCYRWRCADGELFVKVAAESAGMRLAAEAAGLGELAQAGALRVPRVRALGTAGQSAFLALEWIDVRANSVQSERSLGEGLAALHAYQAERFGWRINDFIGPTPQANGWCDDWATFWRERRLRPQLELAVQRGFGRVLEAPGSRLLDAVEALLGGHRPSPALLHGDLWAGNWFTDQDGRPVVFDPAVYYGDRETDLAMTRLFGGFGPDFYTAYEQAAPLPAGHELRAELYNLYHVINHANLFGGAYAGQARIVMERLLAATRG